MGLKAVAPKTASEAVPINPLLEAAKGAYHNLKRSWFDFAKRLAEVKAGEAWVTAGYESFKEFCAEEYGEISYGVIVKYLRVAADWGGAIDLKLEAAPDAPLPSYDACYELSTHEDRMPKGEVPKLRKAVLEGKLSLRDLREKVETLTKVTERAEDKARSVVAKKEERALAEKAVEDEAARGPDLEVDETDDLDPDIEKHVKDLLTRVRWVKDNLPILTTAVTAGSASVVKLAEELEALHDVIDDYVDKISEICSPDGEGEKSE